MVMKQERISDFLSNQTIIPILPNRYSYFLSKKRNYSHWFMLTPILLSKQVIDVNVLKHAFSYLLQYHDSLRINVHFLNNELIQTIEPFKKSFYSTCNLYLYKKDCGLSFKNYVEDKIQLEKQNISFPDKLLKFLVFHNVDNEITVLAFLFHHILADGYSFKILMEDLFDIYEQILQNKAVALSNKRTSYKKFCEHSINFFKKNLKEESAYWKKMPWSTTHRLSFDYQNDISSNIEGNTVSSISSINLDSIDNFMDNFKGEGSYGLVKILLIAIAKAYKCHFNSNTMLINYVYNGRFCSDESLHLDRTVGWFSEGAPIFIPTKDSLKSLINTVEAQIDKLYYNNSSYGYLKYIFQELKDDFFPPEISINYTPPWLGESKYKNFMVPTSEFNSHLSSPANTQRVYLLNAKAYFSEKTFILSWNYSRTLFDKSKMDKFSSNCLVELKNIMNELYKSF